MGTSLGKGQDVYPAYLFRDAGNPLFPFKKMSCETFQTYLKVETRVTNPHVSIIQHQSLATKGPSVSALPSKNSPSPTTLASS